MMARVVGREGELRQAVVTRLLGAIKRDERWEDNGWQLTRKRGEEDGTPGEMVFEVKVSYFYRAQGTIHHRFAEFKRSVETRCPDLTVEMAEEPDRELLDFKDRRVRDHFAAWPKTSYLSVLVVVRSR